MIVHLTIDEETSRGTLDKTYAEIHAAVETKAIFVRDPYQHSISMISRAEYDEDSQLYTVYVEALLCYPEEEEYPVYHLETYACESETDYPEFAG